MKYTSLFLFLFLSVTLSAQPTLEWSRTFGGSNYDESDAIRQTTDGGFIVAGYTHSTNGDVFGNHGGGDFWVIKLNAQGTLQWKKLFGGSVNDIPSDIQQTPDGGYVVVGYTSSNDGDVTGQHGETDGWIIKISAQGALEWQRALGGSLRDYIESVAVAPDGGYILAGHSKSSDGDLTENFGDIDLWVVKLDAVGGLEWQKSMGGSGQDLALSVSVTSDGGYIVAGETSSQDGHITFNNGNVDSWVIKFNNVGTVDWQRTYGGLYAEDARDIKQTADGGYIAVGMTGSINSGDVYGNENKGSIDYWVIKLNTTGELEWQNPLGGSDSDWGGGITQTVDGSYVVVGAALSSDVDVTDLYFDLDMWLVKLNSAGEIQWQRIVGGTDTDASFSVVATTNGGYALGGYTRSTDGDLSGQLNRGKSDICVIKLAPETVSATTAPGQSGLSFSPNPAQTWVQITGGEASAATTVSIRDMSGKIVHTCVLPAGELLDVRALPAGTYQVAVRAEGSRTTYFGKLVVLR